MWRASVGLGVALFGLRQDRWLFLCVVVIEQEKGIRWMPWHQEAMKDVARCENPGGAASKL